MKTSLILSLATCLLFVIFVGPTSSNEGHGHGESELVSESFLQGASELNGESIYIEGMTLGGKIIPTDGGPHWLSMHGGGCSSCHGADGRGGFTPMMCTKSTPVITLEALLSGTHDHGGKKEKHTPYTLETIRRALESSVNPDGKPFVPCMPRWYLTDNEFRDLISHMLQLPQ